MDCSEKGEIDMVAASKKKHRSQDIWQDKVFYAVIYVVLSLLTVCVLIPILYVIANSFSSGSAVVAGKVFIWPVDFSLEGYQAIFSDKSILQGYGNTILYTVVGTAFDVLLTIAAAWPLSRKDLPGRGFLMTLFVITMIFKGGMIPDFLLVRSLGIMNTRWAIILPMALNVYNMVILRTFFANTIPLELMEAAQLDGCTEFKFLRKIVLPLSKSGIAVIVLYYAVFHWNAFFNAFLYLSKQEYYPLQLVLREFLLASTLDAADMMSMSSESTNYLNRSEVIKFGLILVACVPIWCVYPFVQKHFVKGVMLGAIKG